MGGQPEIYCKGKTFVIPGLEVIPKREIALAWQLVHIYTFLEGIFITR